MKLARVRDKHGRQHVVAVDATGYRILTGRLQDLFQDSRPMRAGRRVSVQDLLSPSLPGKLVTLRDGARSERGASIVEASCPASVIGPHDTVLLPRRLVRSIDWRVCLAVIIGREARNIEPADALNHVFGYTVANEISALLELSEGKWVRARGTIKRCPLGPVLVTADEISEPQDLRLTATINGQLAYDAPADLMRFDLPTLISVCSHIFTLHAGDVMLAGAPRGGTARPLKVGDTVECVIGGIGTLRNAIRPDTSSVGPRHSSGTRVNLAPLTSAKAGAGLATS